MDIFAEYTALVREALVSLWPDEVQASGLAEKFVVEPPRDAAHGDLSTNAAMVAAKPLGKNPREIAVRLSEALAGNPDIEAVEIAGPGFLNLRLKAEVWQRVPAAIFRIGAGYGRTDVGEGQRVNVEYVSANPTGPMHVGHTRGAVYGDTLASLMAFSGFDVTREFYMNDAGGQVDVLARSAFLRYREALGEKIEIPNGLYPGDYLVPVGAGLKDAFGDSLLDKPESEWLPVVRERAIDAMMDLIRQDLASLNVHHDVFFSERSLHGPDGDIVSTLAWLREQGLVYQGRLAPPKGKLPDEWEDREQTLFRAEQFGDDTDRALVKSDGTYTYFAADIAYHRNKVLRGFYHLIDVLGADHSGYVKRIQAATRAISENKAEVDVRICQLVRLLRDGETVKMSKRSGDLVTVADLVDEVGPDAVRFMLLFRRNDMAMDFDFAVVKEQSRDNPVFYVQYAHARVCSIFRTAAREMPDLDLETLDFGGLDYSEIKSDRELDLIKVLAQWPRTVAAAALAHEPHRIAFYLHEVASVFHGLWAQGNENLDLRFVNVDQRTLTISRLGLAHAVRQVLRNGLAILGVTAPEELS